jgi:hypothetical protein
MRSCLALGCAAAALFGVILCGPVARAQECALGPVALPALSGPPEWEDFNGDGFWRPELHDPRWSGAPLDFLSFIPSSGGAPADADDVGIRVVADGKIVYVSFQVQVDSDGPTADDYVHIGLSEGSSNGAYALKIAADTSGTAIAAPPAPPPPAVVAADSPAPTRLAGTALTWWHTVDATSATPAWGAPSSTPLTWLKGAVFNRAVAGSPRWAITVRLDLSGTGLGIAGDTRFFFGATVHHGTGDVLVGNATPKTAAETDKVGDSIIPDKSANWVQFSEPGTACTSGMTVDSSDIGTWTGVPGATSGGSLTNSICAGAGGAGFCTASTGENTFRVTARKVDNTAGIGTFAVRARLRIADWGSQYWQFGRWRDIAVTPTGTGIFNAPVADLSNANGWYWLTPVDAGDGTSAVSIDYKCTKLGADTYCPKLVDETQSPPGSGRSHQCMLVELGQPPPGAGNPKPFKVRKNATYRNMDYENLSTSDVPATISLEGLKAALGEAKDRDVYLYVENHNLPPHGAQAFALNSQDMAFARRFAENPIAVPTVPGKPVPGKGDKRAQAAGTKAPAKPIAGAAAAAAIQVSPAVAIANRIATSDAKLSNGLPVHDVLAMGKEQLLDAVWPTYRVRVYFDSGKTYTANGKTNRVLVPMVPFGFHFSHDGVLYGFSQALSAMPGVVIEQLPEGWFKMHLASEGSAKIRTQITAEESPAGGTSGPPCPVCKPEHRHCNCRLVGLPNDGAGELCVALALGLSFALRRRQGKRARN